MPLSDVILVGAVALFGLAVFGTGLYIASIGAKRMRIARALGDAEPTPLSDVPGAGDLVEFEGTARASDDDALEAPLSGTDCLAYTVSARTRDDDRTAIDGSETDEAWRLEGQVSASATFVVEDGTDRVEVDPANAALSLDDWETTQTMWIDAPDLAADARGRLNAVGLETDSDLVDRPESTTARQYREQRLEAGGDVHVFGGSVVDSSDPTRPVTVGGDDWFEISVGDRSTVLPDRRRSGSMYLIFGGLLAVPGLGFTLAGVVGLVSTLLL